MPCRRWLSPLPSASSVVPDCPCTSMNPGATIKPAASITLPGLFGRQVANPRRCDRRRCRRPRAAPADQCRRATCPPRTIRSRRCVDVVQHTTNIAPATRTRRRSRWEVICRATIIAGLFLLTPRIGICTSFHKDARPVFGARLCANACIFYIQSRACADADIRAARAGAGAGPCRAGRQRRVRALRTERIQVAWRPLRD